MLELQIRVKINLAISKDFNSKYGNVISISDNDDGADGSPDED
jgi:hypothetical protein